MLLVERAIRSVVSEPVAKDEASVYEFVAGRPDVEVNIWVWTAEHAVCGFADAEYVVGYFQLAPILIVRPDRSDRHEDVDDRLRGQPRNCRRSNVLDRDNLIAER